MIQALLEKFTKFTELKADLHRCEPRVISLQVNKTTNKTD